MPTAVKDNIRMDRWEVARCTLYVKCREKGLKLSDNDLSMLCLFLDTADKDEVITTGLERGYIRSWQSGENKVSALVNMELLEKTETKKRVLHRDLFPQFPEQEIVVNLFIHNINRAAR